MNGAIGWEKPTKLDSPPLSGLDPPKPPPPSVPVRLEPPIVTAFAYHGNSYATAALSLERERQAAHDLLTGLPNRKLLIEQARAAIEDANAEDEVVGFSAGCSRGCRTDASTARGDLDFGNDAQGDVTAVFAKPKLGLT